jgi:hypothetical protein
MNPFDRKPVASKQDYIAALWDATCRMHGCGAVHRKTVLVQELFQGKTVWKGEVEVFDLQGHPQARRAYAWARREEPNDEGEQIVAVLEIPPIDSALRAVQAQLVKCHESKPEHHDK